MRIRHGMIAAAGRQSGTGSGDRYPGSTDMQAARSWQVPCPGRALWRSGPLLVALVSVLLPATGVADELAEVASAAETAIVARMVDLGLDGILRQLDAPGKSREEKQAMIDRAVGELARCKVETGLEYARIHDLSAISMLRLLAGWELTDADRHTMEQLRVSDLLAFQRRCDEAFGRALPTRRGG